MKNKLNLTILTDDVKFAKWIEESKKAGFSDKEISAEVERVSLGK